MEDERLEMYVGTYERTMIDVLHFSIILYN